MDNNNKTPESSEALKGSVNLGSLTSREQQKKTLSAGASIVFVPSMRSRFNSCARECISRAWTRNNKENTRLLVDTGAISR
jgi:hypothetical protein